MDIGKALLIAVIQSPVYSMGTNTPELSKHRKRSHTNLNVDILRSHAGSLKYFLLCPWMKKQGWAIIRKATENLAEAMECYALELIEKNRAIQKRNETRLESALDDLAFTVINATDDHPILLNGIVDELQRKGKPIFVRDFGCLATSNKCTYTHTNAHTLSPQTHSMYTHMHIHSHHKPISGGSRSFTVVE